MDIIEAVGARKSIRDFRPDPVPKKILKEILESACRAPSAGNSQPWEFTVVSGDILDNVRQANIEKLNSGAPIHPDLTSKGWPRGSVYRRRQVEIAKQIFKLMNIPREDKEKRARWMELGFRYFNAPAAIIVCADRFISFPRFLFDIGALSQTICLVALGYDLGTCILNQGIMFPEVLYEFTDIPTSKRIVIAIAIGYPNWDFPANKLESLREPVENITTWCGC